MAQISLNNGKINKVNSPEQLNDYIRTASPSAWLVVTAAVILLVSVLVWGIFGVLDTSVSAGGIADGESVVCYLADVTDIAPGNKVSIEGLEGEVLSVSEKPLSSAELERTLGVDEYTLYCLKLSEWNYVVEISVPAGTLHGYVTAEIVTQSINPISFILG